MKRSFASVCLVVTFLALGCGGGAQQTTDRAGQDIKSGAKTTEHDVETLGKGHGDAGSLESH